MPYKSKAQEAYFKIHRKELEAQGVNVDEWNKASKGKKLPKHAGSTELINPNQVLFKLWHMAESALGLAENQAV